MSPPVILTVCNRTETSARVEHYFRNGDAHWPELHAPSRTLRVDSKVIEKVEVGESAGADKDDERDFTAVFGFMGDILGEAGDAVGGRSGHQCRFPPRRRAGRTGRAFPVAVRASPS